jgi:hypothetical protein
MANKYSNTRANTIASSGGAVRVTLSSNVGQGNGGTALPCKGCFVQALDSNTDVVRMNIDIAASDILGIDLGRPHISDGTNEYGSGAAQPLFVPIDDVSKLYFYSGHGTAVIDILYLQG